MLDSVRGADMYYWIDREIAPDLDALGRHIVRAFGVRERPFHFEFFRLPDGELAALEVNMRQPGGLTVDMWNWTSDIDFYRAWAEVIVNGTTRLRGREAVVRDVGRPEGRPDLPAHARRRAPPIRASCSSTTSASTTCSRPRSATTATSCASHASTRCWPRRTRSWRGRSRVHVEERSWYSDALGQDMALKVHGHAGRPVVAFPSQDGRYWDFESWGMIEACAAFIDEGRARIISVDGIDWQSWTNQAIGPADRARRHDDYDRTRRRCCRRSAVPVGAGDQHQPPSPRRCPNSRTALRATASVLNTRTRRTA